ncbi:MAG TPA: hypothetical protein ENN90_10545, partial [Mariniphaga anaerophila]|nr:hypothetical protein [Mariniphaga anaerophila]
MGVGISPQSPASKSSPHNFTTYEEKKLNLAAYDNQNVFGRIWFFSDTEYPHEQSEWKKFLQGSYSTISYAQNFTTIPLTKTDDGATYIAFLKTTNYTTSGTMPFSERWFTPQVGLTGNVTIPSGKSLTIRSGTTVNLNGYNIISTGGAIVLESGAVINPTIRVMSGSTLKGLCTSISAAANAASSGDKVVIMNSHTLSTDETFKSGVTLEVASGKTLTLNGKKITVPSGSFNVASSSVINPYIRRTTSTNNIIGLYPTIQSAVNDASSSQQIRLAAASYTENVSLKNGVGVIGQGRSSTTLNGNVTFSYVSNASLQ